MSKVDLSVFEEIAEEVGLSLSDTVYELASGELDELCDVNLEDYLYDWIKGDTGGEGQGEYCYGIFKLKDTIYKAEWSYYSYHGCDYDDIESTLKIVKPVEKTVVFYE